MKRSEMIEIMTRVILNSETEFRLNEEEAELMLRAIENAGMVPPAIKVTNMTRMVHPKTGEEGEFWTWTLRNEWEK
jgi:hypothetical protein